jgi:hypothetical protein
MGLLDDAIREHLDLKRRRGADPTEVERAEREALGPVRRDPFEHAEDEPHAEVSVTEPGAYDQAAEEGYDEHEPADMPPAPRDEPFAEDEPLAEDEPFAGAEPFSEHEPFAAEGEEPFAEDEPFAEERPGPAPDPVGTAGEETAEYDVEGTFEAEHPPPPEPHRAPEPPAHEEPAHGEEEEDVLEETPEFLQDAPEHDRLWFEQRPPKDFDFDG